MNVLGEFVKQANVIEMQQFMHAPLLAIHDLITKKNYIKPQDREFETRVRITSLLKNLNIFWLALINYNRVISFFK